MPASQVDLVTKSEEARYLGLTMLAMAGGSALARLIGPVIDFFNNISSGFGYQVMLLVCFICFIAGTICISYTRARISPTHRHFFDKGLKSLASRDIRLFLIMLGAVIGQAYFCLITIAALTNLVVFYRLIYIYRYIGQENH